MELVLDHLPIELTLTLGYLGGGIDYLRRLRREPATKWLERACQVFRHEGMTHPQNFIITDWNYSVGVHIDLAWPRQATHDPLSDIDGRSILTYDVSWREAHVGRANCAVPTWLASAGKEQ